MSNKESMSSIMRKMQQVPEKGIFNESSLGGKQTIKPLVNDNNSVTNHLRAFSQIEGELGTPSLGNKPVAQTQLTEENKMKVIGGLQVVKELLEGDLTTDPESILTRVKTILGNF
jgi:hypothetical protein